MLFKLVLPPEAAERMLGLCRVQLALFRWAAGVTAASDDLPECYAWLADPAQSGLSWEEGAAAERWLGVSNATARRALLLAFARRPERDAKLDWSHRIDEEFERFSDAERGPFTPLPSSQNQTSYEQVGSDLLLKFYDDFRAKDGLNLPLPPHTKAYTSQHFLKAIQEANRQVALCPFCQINAYATVGKNTGGDVHIYTALDHFLPKDHYPHLCIHPYNLIPACHTCNSSFKGVKDPLQPGDGRALELPDIWLPYRSDGLWDRVALSVRHTGRLEGTTFHLFEFGGLHARPAPDGAGGPTDETIAVWIALWERIYQPRNKWNQHSHLIGETMFRRIREFLRFSPTGGADTFVRDVLPYLDELICVFEREDTQRAPYALPMAWTLAALLGSGPEQANRALIDELKSWFALASEEAEKRRLAGSSLRRALPPTSPPPVAPAER